LPETSPLEWAPPLDEMTVSDKLHAMEQIWDDLCRNPENVPSPSWHSDILQAREGVLKRARLSLRIGLRQKRKSETL
jgi:hypothetical protein